MSKKKEYDYFKDFKSIGHKAQVPKGKKLTYLTTFKIKKHK